ncbi:unnamed protein product [Cuscuta epithymum]|uniref:adenylate kinase n=1 Tax=Cuscuta epithymum TaxID=186058 RepID=A0AAV0DH61_9ASTE|nr:unnamed protein product [Cuscuta epithymum]
MERRLLNRNQGREDDNICTVRKRFEVYRESTLPVVEYYKSKGKLREIDADKPAKEIFEAVKVVFTESGGNIQNRRDGSEKVNIQCNAWKMAFKKSLVG